MTSQKVRTILSLVIVGFFVLASVIIALTPVIGGYPPKDYTEHLKTFASLYSGITGLILGYWFGKKDEARKQRGDLHAGEEE